MSEPKLEIDAILDSDGQRPFKPLTVARYALLDLIDSPFLGKQNFSMMSVIPTWFVMTSDKSELRKYHAGNSKELVGDAMDKADEIDDPKTLVTFTKEFLKYIEATNKIAPDNTEAANVEKKGKKAQTAS